MNFIKRPLKYWIKLAPWLKIIVGMVLGVVVGFALGEKAIVFKPLGTIFVNAIMMMVTPVIFVSLVCGVISMKDPAKMGRVAIKTFALYFTSMSLGTSIALFMSRVVFSPGRDASLGSLASSAAPARAVAKAPNLVEMLVDIVPSNVFVAFSQNNVLQVIFLALMFGLSIGLVGKPAEPVERFFNALSEVILKLVQLVMSFAPYGIFALMAVVAGMNGLEMIAALMCMVGVIYVCFFIVMIVVYGGGLTLARLNPLVFFRKMLEAQIIAFSTASSAATLPVNMKVAEHKLGVDRGIVSFVLPLGSTVNMDGLSTYLGVIAVFAANLYGIELSWTDMITIVFTSTLAAVGCAGVPAAGLIVLPVVLSAVGLPLEVVGMVAAVSRIIEMMSTAMNITGDTFAAVLVARSEGELDLCVYNDAQVTSAPRPLKRSCKRLPRDKPKYEAICG